MNCGVAESPAVYLQDAGTPKKTPRCSAFVRLKSGTSGSMGWEIGGGPGDFEHHRLDTWLWVKTNATILG